MQTLEDLAAEIGGKAHVDVSAVSADLNQLRRKVVQDIPVASSVKLHGSKFDPTIQRHYAEAQEIDRSDAGKTYFIAEYGFMLYGVADSILLNRQVALFMDMRRMSWDRNLRYCRLHALMASVSPMQIEPVEVDTDTQPLAYDQRLDPESYFSISKPESILGFLGNNTRLRHNLSLRNCQPFFQGSAESCFNGQCLEEDVQRILPSFWVKPDLDKLGLSLERAIEQLGLFEMFDVATGRFDWFMQIHDGPFASPLPLRVEPQLLDRLVGKLHKKYAYARIYVTVQGTGISETAPRIPDNLRAALNRPVSLDQFRQGLLSQIYALRPFHYRWLGRGSGQKRQQWERLVRDLLTASAKSAIARLDDSSLLSF